MPKSAHTDQRWRIHELAPDFDLSDVWALPTPGGPDDFPLLPALVLHADHGETPSPIVRALFTVRWKLGQWLHLDGPDSSVGARVASLRERLPEAERAPLPTGEHAERAASPDASPGPVFVPIYETDREWAGELANKTVHCVMHLGWVPDPDRPGGFRGQMAVLVKPNGVGGRLYLAAIAPFRHLLVYPAILRGAERRWQQVVTTPYVGPAGR